MNKGQTEDDPIKDTGTDGNGPATGVAIIETYLKNLSGKPGVYRMLNADGKVLYVGKAKSLKMKYLSFK